MQGGRITGLSQEHGILKIDNTEILDSIKPGQVVLILPVHSCLTANLMKKYQTLEGNIIIRG